MKKRNWTTEDILEVYNLPFNDLLYKAATIHRENHDPNKIQISSLISVKTGGCPEDCAYCPQAARYHTHVKVKGMLPVEEIKTKAINARHNGISRVCLGAAWRNVKDGEDFETILEMVREVTKLDMEVCCTLGMITENQAKRLEEAGLYAYNHNIDSSEDYYEKIISTRAFQDRLDTIENVRKTSITLCSGGIIGMGESVEDRCGMLKVLANMNPQPESVPINSLVPVDGTPLEDQQPVGVLEFARMIATARVVLPKTQVRLSAGRSNFSKEGQALCFLAGANSIFAGDKLLTTPNPNLNEDLKMMSELKLKTQVPFEKHPKRTVVEKKDSQIPALDENPKWTRPVIKIERNKNMAKRN